ncbi:hypothetical protein CJ030_MR7G000008 [Morella rubra]|uniref:Uncharacterized protein n=1 Tax=Morella rubra TaxID=262757 RepID=A0A6A1V2Q7_9ROSI|nr:hypothetical protein CJ030_MR7G000008 [Morella rubra]
MDDQGWIEYLKRDGIASIDLVREFYTALLDVEDIYTMLWTVTIRGVTFQLSPDILAAFMGLQTPIGANPTVRWQTSQMQKTSSVLSRARTWCWSNPSSDRSTCSLSAIFCTSSSPKTLTADSHEKMPYLGGELMLAMARGCVVDFPLYVFLTLRSEAKIISYAVLPYNLLLT